MAVLTCILSDRNMARSHVGGCSEQPSCFVYHTELVWCVAFLGVWGMAGHSKSPVASTEISHAQ